MIDSIVPRIYICHSRKGMRRFTIWYSSFFAFKVFLFLTPCAWTSDSRPCLGLGILLFQGPHYWCGFSHQATFVYFLHASWVLFTSLPFLPVSASPDLGILFLWMTLRDIFKSKNIRMIMNWGKETSCS